MNEFSLFDYLHIIRKRKQALILFFIVAFSLVMLYTFTATPQYMASARLLIERVEPYSITDRSMPTKDPQFYATQYELIQSEPVALRVVEQLQGDKVFYDYFSDPGTHASMPVRALLALASYFGEPVETNWNAQAVETIKKNIVVRPVRDTNIIEVSFVANEPDIAKTVSNAIAKAYIEALLDLRMGSSRHAMEWMTRKVEEERAKLEASEARLQQYMQQSDIVTLEDKVTVVPQKLSALSADLIKSETTRRELETLYNKIKDIPPKSELAETIPAISTDVTISSLRAQIIEAEALVADYSKKYGRKHPAMIKALDELEVLRAKKINETQRVIQTIRNQYEIALSNEKNLRQRLGETKQEALTLNEKFIQYGVLKRDVETNKQLFDSLFKRMKEQSINEEVQSVEIMILEEAKAPRKPTRPDKLKNFILAIALGLVGGIGLALLTEAMDNTIKSPDEAEDKLGLPVLGMVSQIPEADEEGSLRVESIVSDRPKSAYAESYKALRTAVMLSSAESPPKRILVTSMGPSEGKTSTCINLALAIGFTDKKVLIIDCDLRRPRVHKVFNMKNADGLSTMLTGGKAGIIKEGPTKNVHVITSGPIPPNPSELLGSESFRKFLDAADAKYDVILLDSPPILSVTDSLIVSRVVNGTILVSKAEITTYDMARKGIKLLEDMKSNLLGIFINAVNLKRGAYYYSHHNYHYYHYYSDYK